jgi:APA family basic amino acid/polyamine antiporter
MATRGNENELPRSIGIWGGAAIMVGVIIGSGIYRVPTTIAQELGSPTLILLLWVAGGVLCLLGALTYAELGTMFPRSGGVYVFLHEGFGPRAAFIFGWTYLLITQPMAAAGIATVFSEHANRLFGIDLDVRIVTCGLIVLLTWLNVTGMRRGAGVAVALTGLKALALALIVVVALVLMKGSGANFASTPSPQPFVFALAPVLAAILWTYDGWSDTVAVAEEITEPQRRIPRIFLLGTLGTMALYLAVNATYIWLVPLSEMRETATVAPLVMQRLVGPAGSTLVTIMILVSTLGATHASLIVGSRVIFAQARDRLFFAFPGHVHPVYRTPAVALWVQAALACLAAIVLKHFEALMGGFIFTMWIFYGLSAAAIIVLRVRRPELARPYKCWGYPVVPVIFTLAAAGMTLMSIRESPKDTLPWLGVLLAGIPAYSLWRRFAVAGRTGE